MSCFYMYSYFHISKDPYWVRVIAGWNIELILVELYFKYQNQDVEYK